MPSLTPLLEAAAADVLHGYAASLRTLRPESDAEALAVGLGCACFAGTGNPLTTVKGLGPHLAAADLDAIEAFFAERDAKTVLELASWVDGESIALLERRGYERFGEEDVMLRASCEGAGIEVEHVDEVTEWARVLSVVFGGEESAAWMDIGVSIGKIEGSVLVGLREGENLAAVGQLIPGLRVATFACDGTLEAARGRGYQRRLIEARVGLARGLGLAWCTSEVAPGSGSQRNYERCGFEKAYTRMHWRLG
jgi:GNAT superfamily N-acetyltransferase